MAWHGMTWISSGAHGFAIETASFIFANKMKDER